MKHLKTHYLALRSLVAVMTLGMMFLPGTAFALDTSTTTTTSAAADAPDEGPALPILSEFPLLGSNITIQIDTDETGAVASVTVDGELADFTMEQDDDEIKIEFSLSNDGGDFQVEVKFEDDDMKVEVQSQNPAEPGDYVWVGATCDGGDYSIAYTITEDGSLVLGDVTGDVAKSEAGADEIQIRYADGTKVELQLDDGQLSAEQKCSNDDDHDSNDDQNSDDNDSDEDGEDSDHHDSDSDDHDSGDDDHDSGDDDHDSSDDGDSHDSGDDGDSDHHDSNDDEGDDK